MKIAFVGKECEEFDFLEDKLQESGFKVVKNKPEIVISYGGDGSLIYSERQFPGIPKYPIRRNSICKKCESGPIDQILHMIKQRKFKVKCYNKLKGIVISNGGRKTIIATNDIVIRNLEPYTALRFGVKVNGNKLKNTFIGDGVIIATPFGSTGYFYSASRKSFSKGIGLAFNNNTMEHPPIIKKNAEFEIEILRNKATVSHDNETEILFLNEKDKIRISESNKSFKLIKIIK